MEEQRKKRVFFFLSLWLKDRKESCSARQCYCSTSPGEGGHRGPAEEEYGGSASRSPQSHMFPCSADLEQPYTSVRFLDIPLATVVGVVGEAVGGPSSLLLPLGGGNGLAAGSGCLSSAPSCNPSRTLVHGVAGVTLLRVGTGAVCFGAGCGVVVADVAALLCRLQTATHLTRFQNPALGPGW